MKTTNRNHLLITALCTIALGFGTAAYAEKGAERLVRLAKAQPAVAAPVAAAEPAMHRCPACADSLVTVIDKATKGPNHATAKVARHNCGNCNTAITTEGVGKAKRDVAIHSCNAEIRPACCRNS